MSKYCYLTLLSLYCSFAFTMDNVGSQLEFCLTRKTYNQQVAENTNSVMPKCFFCDKDSLKSNFILYEDDKEDVRVMMNKNPYSDFDQAIHLLFMPISHKELPTNFSNQELMNQADVIHDMSKKLDSGAYSQEWFTNWGKLAGQSVTHWHSQLKVFKQISCSMPERMKRVKNCSINNIADAFKATKELLESSGAVSQDNKLSVVSALSETTNFYKRCHCCWTQEGKDNGVENNDIVNFVVARFLHNYICLSHYPSCAGEICVVPNRHVSAIKDLSQDELRENMVLAMALLPKMQKYAHNNIRQCDGGNLYTKSVGSRASKAIQKEYHVYTVIMPRTTIPSTPGTKNCNSCKLDYDPNHLFAYLKEEIKSINV